MLAKSNPVLAVFNSVPEVSNSVQCLSALAMSNSVLVESVCVGKV